jgi:hypothetical protein
MEQESLMLRYRFDTLEQLRRHLHLVNGDALLFLPDCKAGEPAPGRRVLLEIAIHERAQQTAVRGQVVVRAQRGSWLQLADTRLALRLRQGGFASRREGRVSADAVLSLRSRGGSQLVAQLFDLGTGGMRVRGAGRLLEGETYTVRLMNSRSVSSDFAVAQVVWCEGSESGLRFVAPRGAQVPQYIALLLEAWMSAPEIEHAAECCSGRGLLEPPLPKLQERVALGV